MMNAELKKTLETVYRRFIFLRLSNGVPIDEYRANFTEAERQLINVLSDNGYAHQEKDAFRLTEKGDECLISLSKEHIIKIGKLIYDKGYNAGKDGNISVRLDAKRILITTSGALLGFLSEDDFVVVDNDGKSVSDDGRTPSSEITLHLGIYRMRPDINAVIHAHAPYCISLSFLDIDTENNLYTLSSGPIPITEMALPSTEESWEKVRPFVKNRSKAILRRHGAVAWGKNLMTAFVKLEETEHFAKSLVNAMSVADISPVDESTRNKLYKQWGI